MQLSQTPKKYRSIFHSQSPKNSQIQISRYTGQTLKGPVLEKKIKPYKYSHVQKPLAHHSHPVLNYSYEPCETCEKSNKIVQPVRMVISNHRIVHRNMQDSHKIHSLNQHSQTTNLKTSTYRTNFVGNIKSTYRKLKIFE